MSCFKDRRTTLDVGACDGQSTWGEWEPTSQDKIEIVQQSREFMPRKIDTN